jgi:PD-(D/E)XK nuclease superfamily
MPRRRYQELSGPKADMKGVKKVKAMKKRITTNPLHDLHSLHDLHVCFLGFLHRLARLHVEKSAISMESVELCLSEQSCPTLAPSVGRCLWSRVHSLKPSLATPSTCIGCWGRVCRIGYEQCFEHELDLHGIRFRRQVPLSLTYRTLRIGCAYRVDLIVENELLVELKSMEWLLRLHHTQART